MGFLQPLLLAALPLVGLPVLIHLINQRRYQTIPWGAMMFLLAATRMSRGYARLRQWLILLSRMLAVATLIFAVSRPLSGGWLGFAAGGQADTTIILLDRSPSMQQQAPGTVLSKFETGRRQLADTLTTLGSSRWVLIDSVATRPLELESPAALLQLREAEPSSVSADVPAMLQAAHDYVQANRAGRTEIWICSDIRQNDWNADGGRWQALRDAFLEFPQPIQFHLLAYAQAAPANLSIQVTRARRQQHGGSSELYVSLRLLREGDPDTRISVPVQFEIEGARSQITIEMTGAQYDLTDHRIPLDRAQERGWGRASIPADLNPADNDFYFVFDQELPRHTVLVTEDFAVARPLQLAAEIAPDPELRGSVEVVDPGQLPVVAWEAVALLLWHAPLPRDGDALAVQSFIERGGQAIFLPPRNPDTTEFRGVRWERWIEEPADIPIETWRGDQDLLANTQSGAALPVGELRVRRYLGLHGGVTPLASLQGHVPLLARLPTARGGAYFCATTPAAADSSLATNGVVLYVLVQRALAAGASVLGNTRQLIAGEAASGEAASGEAALGEAASGESGGWRQVAGPPDVLTTEFAHHAGVYTADERLLAVNRAASEDQSQVLADSRVAELFQGLNFVRVDDQAGSFDGLIQEIWRLFLVSMLVALVVEAGLCLPRVTSQPPLRPGT